MAEGEEPEILSLLDIVAEDKEGRDKSWREAALMIRLQPLFAADTSTEDIICVIFFKKWILTKEYAKLTNSIEKMIGEEPRMNLNQLGYYYVRIGYYYAHQISFSCWKLHID